MDNNNATGALSGALIAGLAHWSRYDDDQARRTRNLKLDLGEVRDTLREYLSRGEVIRSRMPPVQDAQVGLALATQVAPTSAVVPSVTKIGRPEIGEDAAYNLNWPPKTGQFDAQGNVSELGELSTLFLGLTYEELRAFLLGFLQSKSPSQVSKQQIFNASHQLSLELASLGLTPEEYRAAWHWLFTNGVSTAAVDPHRDPYRAPAVVAGSLNGGISAFVPLTSLGNVVPGAYPNRNTDEASHWRITTSAPVGAGQQLAIIRFGTEYRYRSGGVSSPFQPTVISSAGVYGIFAEGITSTTFTLFAGQLIAANVNVDIHVAVIPGQGSEG